MRRPPSDKPVLLHLHVPKCAGMSVSRTISTLLVGRTFGTWNDGRDSVGYQKMTREDRDAWFDAVIGHIRYGEHHKFGRPCVYISATRDPVERICSLFNYLHLRRQHNIHRLIDLKRELRDLNDITPEIAANPRLAKQFDSMFCRVYGNRAAPGDEEAYRQLEKRIMRACRQDRMMIGPLAKVAEFLRAMGASDLPRRNVTDTSAADGFEPASAQKLTPRAREIIESAYCRYDYRLLERIDKVTGRVSGAEFAARVGLARGGDSETRPEGDVVEPALSAPARRET